MVLSARWTTEYYSPDLWLVSFHLQIFDSWWHPTHSRQVQWLLTYTNIALWTFPVNINQKLSWWCKIVVLHITRAEWNNDAFTCCRIFDNSHFWNRDYEIGGRSCGVLPRTPVLTIISRAREGSIIIQGNLPMCSETYLAPARLYGHLPRDADRIISGNWGVVAIWVTHPLWPLRVPLTVICSVILAQERITYKGGWSWILSEVQILPISHTVARGKGSCIPEAKLLRVNRLLQLAFAHVMTDVNNLLPSSVWITGHF